MPAEVIQEVNPILQKMGSSKKKEMAQKDIEGAEQNLKMATEIEMKM